MRMKITSFFGNYLTLRVGKDLTLLYSSSPRPKGLGGGGIWGVGLLAAALEDMGVEHRGVHVLVAEEFLDGADVVASRQEVGGEGVAEGVGVTRLGMPAACAAVRMAFCKVFSWM